MNERTNEQINKCGGEGFEDRDVGEIQELRDATPYKLTEDDLMKMSASKQCQNMRKKT